MRRFEGRDESEGKRAGDQEAAIPGDECLLQRWLMSLSGAEEHRPFKAPALMLRIRKESRGEESRRKTGDEREEVQQLAARKRQPQLFPSSSCNSLSTFPLSLQGRLHCTGRNRENRRPDDDADAPPAACTFSLSNDSVLITL